DYHRGRSGRIPDRSGSGACAMADRTDADTSRDLLLAILARRRGMIDRDQLVAAFGAWAQDQARSMARVLVDQGALDESGCVVLGDLVLRHRDRLAGGTSREDERGGPDRGGD